MTGVTKVVVCASFKSIACLVYTYTLWFIYSKALLYSWEVDPSGEDSFYSANFMTRRISGIYFD